MCLDCSQWFNMNLDNFRRDKKSKDEFNPRCRTCQSLKDHKHYLENSEEIIKTNSQHRLNNVERYMQYDKEYYQRRKELRKAQTKIWYNENKDYILEWTKDWRKTPQGRIIVNMHSSKRQKSKTHRISKKDWIICKEFFEYNCAYCGMPEEYHKEIFSQQLHKDHADPNGNNEISNCLPSCKICNSEKHDTNLVDWYTSNNPKYTSERYDKIVGWLDSFE